MRSKTFGLVPGLALLIGSIVVPATRSVNHDAKAGDAIRGYVADGMPLPPPSPTPKASKVTIVADGMPLPPPPTPKANETTVIADGMPLPPPKSARNEVAA
jgi:hypothetical protein